MAPIHDRFPTPSELRWFGVIVAVFFGVIGAVAGWRFDAAGLRLGLWCAGAGLALLYYVVKPLRVPFYLSWMTIFAPIGAAMSTLLLGLIYFGVLTPIAKAMVLFGRDRLGRRFDPELSSYWTPCDPSGDLERYFRQT
jgi:hypothetical protein